MTSTAPPTSTGRIFGAEWRALSIGVMAVVSLVAFEAMAVAAAMPVAVRDLDGLRFYAWGFSAFFIASLVGMVLAGDLSDRRGPLLPFGIAVATFGAGLLAAGAATGMVGFVVARAVQGFGAGLVVVVLYVAVGRTYPAHMRPRVFSAMSSAWVVPAVVGPSVAGLVADHLSWRVVFLAVPPLIVPAVLLMLPRLRVIGPAPDAGEMRRRTVPAMLAAGGVTTLQYAGQRLDLLSLPLAAASVLLLALSLPRLLPAGFFRARPGLPSAVLMRGLLAGSFFGAETFLPLMLVEERGVATAAAGATLTVAALSWSAGSWIQGRPSTRTARYLLVRRGATLVVIGIAALSLALWTALPPYVAAVGWAVGGLGMGLSLSSTNVIVLGLSPTREQGFNSAALQISDALGSIVLIGAGGAVYAALRDEAGGGDARVFLLVYALMAAVAGIAVVLAGRVRDTP